MNLARRKQRHGSGPHQSRIRCPGRPRFVPRLHWTARVVAYVYFTGATTIRMKYFNPDTTSSWYLNGTHAAVGSGR